jgi:hypothetical protein
MEYPIRDNITLKDLVGEHMLSGFDISKKTIKDTRDKTVEVNVVRFILDGITYEAVENPDDGQRSFLGELEITEEKVSNTFPPQKVICQMKPSILDAFSIQACYDILEITDAVTNKVVAEIGTDMSMLYYPVCITYWNPKNLAINQNK